MKSIKEFYLLKTKQRKIDWAFQLCRVQISFFINDDETILDCDVLQASVLLLFNDSHDGSLEIAHVQEKLAVDHSTLVDILQPMIQPNSILKFYKLFGKELIEVNSNFVGYSDFTRSVYKPTESTYKNRGEDIKDFGKIDAIIVKIMKNTKEMKSIDLIDEASKRSNTDIEVDLYA
ncbi:cullin protein, putative [Theileria equi strain WA]|uniref:Cullin protein, putative n=1 Tax=Theileria equi strain WA TaxID=1537102 RepID=L0B1C9_THEEQ|nr:cullin protein, putative [Theileria equi strain WA]AFZ81313.1 cullin protein, putative [Theileria equi strain WA]|eukprot:XP_004830979.1 cullin protein, putative [Theileria equi strain WA]